MSDENETVYAQALERLENELGWTETDAHDAITSYASVNGVNTQDIAAAILAAPSLARGLGQALYGASFARRPVSSSHYADR